ncbi:MAG: carbohydrate porin [Pseudomonadota bacterium]
MPTSKYLSNFGVFVLLSVSLSIALADSTQRQNLTGNWGGTRDQLEKNGIDLEAVYTFEVFTNVSGGDTTSDSTNVLGNIDLTATLDTEKLGWWKGGTFFIYYENLHGDENKTDDAVGGPLDSVSSLVADSFSQFSAWWYQHEFASGKVRLKAGKDDANTEFMSSDTTGAFINAGFSSPANILYPTFPDPGLGFMGEFQVVDWLSLSAGIYGADLNGRSNQDQGLFDGDHISLAQFNITPTAGDYAGTYRFGGWYSTLETDEIVPDGETPKDYDNNYGLFVLFDQPIYVPKNDNGRRVDGFFELSWAPDDRNLVTNYFAFGTLVTGLIPSRPADQTGLAFSFAEASNNLSSEGITDEKVFELFYSANVNPWLAVQPDLQWILDPGGDGDNAFVAGLRTTITF